MTLICKHKNVNKNTWFHAVTTYFRIDGNVFRLYFSQIYNKEK